MKRGAGDWFDHCRFACHQQIRTPSGPSSMRQLWNRRWCFLGLLCLLCWLVTTTASELEEGVAVSAVGDSGRASPATGSAPIVLPPSRLIKTPNSWMFLIIPDWPKLELNGRVVTAVILGSVGACICAAGGVGGGGLFIPIFNLLLLFDTKTSAALSNFMILGGSIAVSAWNVQQSHPTLPDKPLIDYDVALLLNPNMLLGISIGVLCNIMFPGWLLVSVLTVILFYMTHRSIQTGRNRWMKENTTKKAKLNVVEKSANINEEDDVMERGRTSKSPQRLSDVDSANELSEPLLAGQHLKPSESTPAKIFKLALVWLLFFAVQILRGGEGTQGILELKPCGLAYWLLSSFQIPLAFGLTAWIAYQHSSRTHTTASSNSQVEVEEDVLTSTRAFTLLPAMALVAGIMGGMLGIGGGMIINPMLLELGMHPQVTAATSSFMIFFASSMSVLQFWLLGRIPLEFALLFGVICCVFSCVGIGVLQAAIVKYGRPSVIVFLVSGVMGVSALLMASFGGLDVWHQFQAGDYMGFHDPCG